MRIDIVDNGVGIEEGVKNRIFEPFFTTKEVGEGNGLRLSTVYNIIKKHKGEVNVESKRGEGSRFSIYIPVKS